MSLSRNILFIFFFLIHIAFPSTISVALTSHHRQLPRRPAVADPEVLQCLYHCDNTDVYSYLACQRHCELELYPEEEHQPWTGRSVGPRWKPARRHERASWKTPEYEYGKCMQLCHDEEGEELEECEKVCEERLSAGQRKQDWERERESSSAADSFIVNGGVSMSLKDTDHEKQCEKWCEQFPRGQQRQLCRFRCRKHSHARINNVNHRQQLTGDDEKELSFHVQHSNVNTTD